MRHAPTVSRLRFAPRVPLHRRFRLCVISFQSQHARHNRAAGFSYHTSMLPFHTRTIPSVDVVAIAYLV